jgi:glycosyltransferase involved in cell wall biosynthesis
MLVVAGRPGWLYDDVYAKLTALSLEPLVRFVEGPTADELTALYNGAAALVLPSFYEGFGLPALEAMQCGTPVIVADRASLPEVVGEAGIVVNPEDPALIAEACYRVLTDPDLRARLEEAGLRRAGAFSWRKTAEITLEAYAEALAR